MAPKMYFLLDLNDKTTLKIKGVNTRTSQYTFKDLVEVFLSQGKLTFTGQIQFQSLKLSEGVGVTIKEDLIKSYITHQDGKRI